MRSARDVVAFSQALSVVFALDRRRARKLKMRLGAQQLLDLVGRRHAGAGARAPGNSTPRRRWRTRARPRFRRAGRGGRPTQTRREIHRPRRCCRRNRPEARRADSAARAPGQAALLAQRAQHQRGAEFAGRWPRWRDRDRRVRSARSGNPAAAMIASICCSRSPMPGRTFSTSITVGTPASRAYLAAWVAAAVSWQSTISMRPDVTASRGTSSGLHRQIGMPIPEHRALARSVHRPAPPRTDWWRRQRSARR